MHTIEFDSETERALNYLAERTGKTPDVWLKEAAVKLINSQSQALPEPSALPPLASLIGKGQGCFRDAAEGNTI